MQRNDKESHDNNVRLLRTMRVSLILCHLLTASLPVLTTMDILRGNLIVVNGAELWV
jgi:hypothetical protein